MPTFTAVYTIAYGNNISIVDGASFTGDKQRSTSTFKAADRKAAKAYLMEDIQRTIMFRILDGKQYNHYFTRREVFFKKYKKAKAALESFKLISLKSK